MDVDLITKISDEDLMRSLDVIVLVRGLGEGSSPIWAYALIPSVRYTAFKVAENKGSYDLKSYGQVVASGEGLNPPSSVSDAIQKEYGSSLKFESNFQKAMIDYLT